MHEACKMYKLHLKLDFLVGMTTLTYIKSKDVEADILASMRNL